MWRPGVEMSLMSPVYLQRWEKPRQEGHGQPGDEQPEEEEERRREGGPEVQTDLA